MRRHAAALAIAIALTSLGGCGRAGAKVQTGIDYYEHGAYEGALTKFRDAGADEGNLRSKTHARYLAYRGLAHWHMKQNDDARRYLGLAHKAFADGGDPKWLPSDVREELAKADAELGLTEPTLPGSKDVGAPPSAPADHPSPPGTPPGPPDGAPQPHDKPAEDGSPAAAPSSPTSAPAGSSPTPALPPNTTPPPDVM